MHNLRIGSLFSGIGGLELGLERAGLGHTVWQVEKDEYCRKVLARHWPRAERYEDVKEVGRENLEPVDLICGGFPCQDVSSAGKGAGLAGSRSGLWFEFARIIGELKPQWVVVENVASGAKRWIDDVCAGLGQQGYATLPVPLSASDVGAPHLRRRVFVIAHANRCDIRKQPRRGRGPIREETTLSCVDGQKGTPAHAEGTSEPWDIGPPVSPVRRVDDGVPRWMDRHRIKALGNAVVPQCAEVVGWVIRECYA